VYRLFLRGRAEHDIDSEVAISLAIKKQQRAFDAICDADEPVFAPTKFGASTKLITEATRVLLFLPAWENQWRSSSFFAQRLYVPPGWLNQIR